MTTAMPGETFDLGKWDPLEDVVYPVGKIRIDERGIITLESSEPGFEDALRRIFDAVNVQSEFRIKVPPPPNAEASSVFSRTVSRQDPDLLPSLWEFLQQKHGLQRMVPPPGATLPPVEEEQSPQAAEPRAVADQPLFEPAQPSHLADE